jgi:hypothetical protein
VVSDLRALQHAGSNQELVHLAEGNDASRGALAEREEAEMYIGIGSVVGVVLLILLLMWIF